MTTSGEQLVQNITAVTAYNPIAAALAPMTRPVIRLLVAGQPVTVEEIACTSGLSAEEVERTLRALPDVEWDDAGRVVALGLTTRPTDHVMEFDGRAMYAWCAADSLIFAVLLERPVVNRSHDRGTGTPISIQLGPSGTATAVAPPTAVISWVGETRPEESTTMRSTFCRHIHFSASHQTATDWAADHPGGSVLSMPEAVQAARGVADILSDSTPDRSVA
jgi:alkylmercury lyase